ncbi:MAG TPA: hypothetical protein VIH21_02965, partial [Dehalococcoidia bacterium]
DANDKAFLASFPYVSSPHSGFSHEHHTGVVVPAFAGLGGAALMALFLALGTVMVGRVRSRGVND